MIKKKFNFFVLVYENSHRKKLNFLPYISWSGAMMHFFYFLICFFNKSYILSLMCSLDANRTRLVI